MLTPLSTETKNESNEVNDSTRMTGDPVDSNESHVVSLVETISSQAVQPEHKAESETDDNRDANEVRARKVASEMFDGVAPKCVKQIEELLIKKFQGEVSSSCYQFKIPSFTQTVQLAVNWGVSYKMACDVETVCAGVYAGMTAYASAQFAAWLGCDPMNTTELVLLSSLGGSLAYEITRGVNSLSDAGKWSEIVNYPKMYNYYLSSAVVPHVVHGMYSMLVTPTITHGDLLKTELISNAAFVVARASCTELHSRGFFARSAAAIKNRFSANAAVPAEPAPTPSISLSKSHAA